MTSLVEIQAQTAAVHAAIRNMITKLSETVAERGSVLPALAVAALLNTDVARQACNGLAVGVRHEW